MWKKLRAVNIFWMHFVFLYVIVIAFVLMNDPQQQNVAYIAVCVCHSASLTGLDLKWWLMQFLQAGCHSDPFPAFISTTNESLRSQWTHGSRRARQLLSCCLSGWHNVTVEKQGYMGVLSICVSVCVFSLVTHLSLTYLLTGIPESKPIYMYTKKSVIEGFKYWLLSS